jgi:signal transduction histidine kinase
MAELAEALLELARADAGGAAMPLAEVDLNEIVRGVAGECRAAAEAQRVTVETQLAPGPATAPAHAAGLRRLLLILAGNAFEHTPRGGRVTLTVKAEEGGVVLAVEDTGEGIPKDALPHVFERFFRADTARSSGSGVGLGLSIAQRIAQAHGSEIRVESEAGQGTRFWLRLRA